jgi:hypothetical protein
MKIHFELYRKPEADRGYLDNGMRLMVLILAILQHLSSTYLSAQESGFSYQGFLSERGFPVNGSMDFRFALYESDQPETPTAGVLEKPQLVVTNGIFRTQLDFGPNAFNDIKGWIGISFRTNAADNYRDLYPIQRIPVVPMALVARTVANGSISERHFGQLGSLTVRGLITTTEGGIAFPDGSLQRTATANDSRVNVKVFGAKGDGTTDDSAAFAAAFAAVQLKGGATLLVPAGTYRLTTRLETSVATSIVGEGRGISVLSWSAAPGGIKFNGGETGGRVKRTFSMRGITLTTSVPNAGNALELTSTVGLGNIGKTLDLIDCDFYQSSDGAYWNCGVWLDDIRDTHISNCDFRGQEQESMGTAGIGIRIGGSRSPTGHFINACLFTGLEQAVLVEGTVEGVLISKCGTVGKSGFVWRTDHALPLLNVESSHFDVTESGIAVNNLSGGVIRDCTFYPRKGSASVRFGIAVSGNTDDLHISHCRFARGNPITDTDIDNFNGVVVSAPARNIRIDNSTIIGARTGIWIQGGARDCLILDNVFTGLTSSIVNDGIATRIRDLP